MTYQAPFPYFGGKGMISEQVWKHLGDPDHYLEPFFGSGAVLLNRKDWKDKTETVCDADGHICNVWRSIQFSPEETAKWCDWPVNHADLMARKKYIIEHENYLLEGLVSDPKWHDVECAGYWIWAAGCWIGSGLTRIGQIPNLGNKGEGVHKTQICGKRPHLSGKGMGVHKTSVSSIYDWFFELSDRLRRVRVVCGDFKRILGGDWQDNKWETVGIFFDPPYGEVGRRKNIYHKDSLFVSKEVEDWCLERGDKKNYRIVVAGYEQEYQLLREKGWKTFKWKTNGGYGKTAQNKKITTGQINKHRETLFISPYCNSIIQQMQLI